MKTLGGTFIKQKALVDSFSWDCETSRRLVDSSTGEASTSREARVTVMVGVILVTFLVCTLPSAVVMEVDPSADRSESLVIA